MHLFNVFLDSKKSKIGFSIQGDFNSLTKFVPNSLKMEWNKLLI
jgi:hypothetical protein